LGAAEKGRNDEEHRHELEPTQLAHQRLGQGVGHQVESQRSEDGVDKQQDGQADQGAAVTGNRVPHRSPPKGAGMPDETPDAETSGAPGSSVVGDTRGRGRC